MSLEHLALSLSDRNEIELVKSFMLDRSLSNDMFGIDESPDVYLK